MSHLAGEQKRCCKEKSPGRVPDVMRGKFQTHLHMARVGRDFTNHRDDRGGRRQTDASRRVDEGDRPATTVGSFT